MMVYRKVGRLGMKPPEAKTPVREVFTKRKPGRPKGSKNRKDK